MAHAGLRPLALINSAHDGRPQAWARGHLPPENVVKCFVHWQLQSNAHQTTIFSQFWGRRLKKVNFLKGKTAPPRENPGYAYEFAHPWKNPVGAHVDRRCINAVIGISDWVLSYHVGWSSCQYCCLTSSRQSDGLQHRCLGIYNTYDNSNNSNNNNLSLLRLKQTAQPTVITTIYCHAGQQQ